jgi:ribosomal protein L3 glutamine methyltransferase
MTLVELIASSADALDAAGVSFGHGTDNAYDEAAWLVLWQLGLPLDSDLDDASVADAAVAPAALAQVQALVQRRIDSRVPAAYLTGEAWLQGVPFHVDARCIVPRSLIGELLSQGAIDYWLPQDAQRLLDLCTGGASLAVLAALRYPQLQVDAADISQDALAVAAMNVERHALQQQIRLLQGDGLAVADGRYDLILCNPPYVNSDSMAQLPPEYRAEPALALAGGMDGMDFVRRLLQDAPAVMSEAAVLVLEIGHERAHFESAFPTLDVVWLDTSAGHDQVCVVTRDALSTLSRGGEPRTL